MTGFEELEGRYEDVVILVMEEIRFKGLVEKRAIRAADAVIEFGLEVPKDIIMS